MTLRVCLARRPHTLCAALADELGRPCAEDGLLFRPARVIVPNPNLKRWLQLELARRNRVAINIQFDYLERGLWSILAALASPAKPAPALLEAETLSMALAAALLSNPDDAALHAFCDYLQSDNGGPRARTRRAWQLAARLAYLFREYGYHRESWTVEWLAGRNAPLRGTGKARAALEQAQAALYRRLLSTSDDAVLRNADGGPLYTLPAFARRVLAGDSAPAWQRAAALGPVALFGFSHLSRFHCRLLAALGEHLDLTLFQLNVGARAWPEGPASSDAAPALWGRPGDELLELLPEGPAVHWTRLEEPDPAVTTPSVLGLLQRRLMRLPGNERAPQDASLQVLACPGMRREIEAVRECILANLLADPTLKLTDVAVLTPALDDYKPVLQAVFGRGRDVLPFTLSDSTAAADSVLGQGLLSLLRLASGDFSRAAMTDVLLNPCLLAAVGAGRGDALCWLRWTEALGVYRAAPDGDWRALYSWEQGLARLRLGRLMEPPAPAEGVLTSVAETLVPYSDQESQDARRVELFSTLVASLLARLRPLEHAVWPPARWAAALRDLIERYLAAPEDRPQEEAARDSLLTVCDELRDNEALLRAAGATGLDLAWIDNYIRQRLAAISSRRGGYLAGGVIIAALKPMRPIPFRIVFVVGMGEGAFPGQVDPSLLDLRRDGRELGDVTVPEANRYLFLETLLTARDKVYFSYVARDTSTDEVRHPCSTLLELIRLLEAEVLSTGPFQQVAIPLHASSDKYLCAFARPPAYTDALVTYDARERARALARRGIAVSPPAPPAVAAPLKMPPAMTALDTPIRFLFELLKNPAEAALRRRLGLFDDDETLLEDDDEPFFTRFPGDLELLRGALRQGVVVGHRRAAQAAVEYARAYHEHRRRCSLGPDGAFGELERDTLAASVCAMVERHLARWLEEREHETFYPFVALGETSRVDAARSDVILRFDAPKLSLPNAEVVLHGGLPLVWRDETTGAVSALVLAPKSSPKLDQICKPALEPLLFFAALALESDWAAAVTVAVLTKDELLVFDATLDRVTARGYLTILAADFHDAPAFDMLPIEYASSTTVPAAGGAMYHPCFDDAEPAPEQREAFQQLLQDKIEHGIQYGVYRPMALLEVARPAVPADAIDKARRRLRLPASRLIRRAQRNEAPS